MKNLNIRTIAHVSILLNIFLLVWQGIEFFKIHENGIWFGFVSVVVLGFFKEANDKFGWIKWLLSNGKTTSKFDALMFWKQTAIPFVWVCIYYILYK